MILTVLLDLMRLRSGPQDLPSSRGLLIILAIIYVAQGFEGRVQVFQMTEYTGR